MNKMSGRVVPVWNPYLPKGAAPVKQPEAAAGAAAAARGIPRQVVYLPSCVTRMMGPSASDNETASVHEKLMSLFGKAGYEVSVVCRGCCAEPEGHEKLMSSFGKADYEVKGGVLVQCSVVCCGWCAEYLCGG
jgi:hypothetical protein